MIQRLPIALAQVKAGNTPAKLLNEIRQIIYSLHQAKRIYQKNISQYYEFNKGINIKTNSIFLNFERSRLSHPHRLLLNFTDKIDLRRKDKYIALSNLNI